MESETIRGLGVEGGVKRYVQELFARYLGSAICVWYYYIFDKRISLFVTMCHKYKVRRLLLDVIFTESLRNRIWKYS